MKKIAVICLFAATLGCLLFWLHGRRGLVMVQTYESDGKSWDATTKIRGGRVLVNVPDGTSTIFDLASGDATIINHTQKTFVKYSMAQMAGRTRAFMKQDPAAPLQPPQLTDTGKMEMVDGYNAEIYAAETPVAKFTCWIAKDYPGYAAVNERLKKYRLMERNSGLYPDVSKLDGMVVKSEIALSGGKTITSTLVSAKIEPLDGPEFQVPADYTEILPPAAPPATPAADSPIPGGQSPNP